MWVYDICKYIYTHVCIYILCVYVVYMHIMCIYAYTQIQIHTYAYEHVYRSMHICMCIYFFPPDDKQTSLAIFLEASPFICAVKTEEFLRSMLPL